MHRYFFDTDDDDYLLIDDIGHLCLDAATARQQALKALPDMARDKMLDGDRRTFVVGSGTGAGGPVTGRAIRATR